jgi:hypothetical protein
MSKSVHMGEIYTKDWIIVESEVLEFSYVVVVQVGRLSQPCKREQLSFPKRDGERTNKMSIKHTAGRCATSPTYAAPASTFFQGKRGKRDVAMLAVRRVGVGEGARAWGWVRGGSLKTDKACTKTSI